MADKEFNTEKTASEAKDVEKIESNKNEITLETKVKEAKDSVSEVKKEADAELNSEKPGPHRKKFSAFSKGLFIYSGILVSMALIVLIVLFMFLNAFEHSRPLNCVKDYLIAESENGLTANCLAALDILDENIQTREEGAAYINEILPEIKYGRSSKLSTPESPAYILSYNKKPIGTVYLRSLEKHPFGFTFWKVDRDEYNFSSIVHTHHLLLPSDYSVSVNGCSNVTNYIVDDSVEYNTLSSFYNYYDDLPKLVKYEFGSYLGPESLVIKDAGGNYISPDMLTEPDFLSNCTEETISEIKSFTDKFISNYVAYAANLNGSYYYYFMVTRDMTVPYGQLFNRLGQALGSFGYTTILSCDIISNDINLCYEHNGCYFVDISYVTETLGRADAVQEANNIRMSIVPYNGGFRAETMFNY